MKIITIGLIVLNTQSLIAQTIKTVTNTVDGAGALIASNTVTTLKNVTIGFAAGISHSLRGLYDYSLSPADNSLKIQKLPRTAFVVSSMVAIKFSPLEESSGRLRRFGNPASWYQKLALNVGLNLIEVSNEIKFNKAIDGGLGIGYFFRDNAQIALMFDLTSVRRMRSYIEESYENKPIPKGNAFYNALDISDNNLFYPKLSTGLSLKVVFSL